MSVYVRPMQPKDIPRCVEIIAAHPVIGPRYGGIIGELRSAWSKLLVCQAKSAVVFERHAGAKGEICFVGVSVFAKDDFVLEIKTAPLRWFGPRLAERIVQGKSPVLSDRELREANSSDGLNLVVWEGCIRTGLENDNEIHRTVMNAFIEDHRGYLWKELIASQVESADRLRWTITSGGLFWDAAKQQYTNFPEQDAEAMTREPHIIGVTRNIDLGRRGEWSASWVGSLFDYRPPRFGFSCSQQKLLLAALASESGTDKELAETLGLSLPTVKNVWRSIYQRVADREPDLLPEHALSGEGGVLRGREKRRPLLAELRRHPEELRPVSRRLLMKRLRLGRFGVT